MRSIYLLASIASATLLSGCGVANNPTVCTNTPETAWLDQGQFQASLLADGYQIKEFKVTEGKCYEIYGTDATGNKVEIYFNPTNGEIVKQETH